MIKAKRYKSEALAGETFDAIVIGSGMGGLTTAALLAKAKKRVLVLERHYTVGGFTHVFRRKKHEWDVGLHYIGEVHRPRSVVRRLFDDISDNSLQWAEMPGAYDRAIFPDASYDFVGGREAFVEGLVTAFPRERRAIERYLELIHAVTAKTQNYYATKVMPAPLAGLARPFMASSFEKLAARSVAEVLTELTDDKKLRGVLCTQWGDYGMPPQTASFAIHAMVVKHYLAGAAYPVGGAGAIAETVVPTIEAAGGRVLVRAEVAKLIVHEKQVEGVVMANGDELRAPLVISAAGLEHSLDTFIADNEGAACDRVRRDYASATAQVKPSYPHVCLYVGFDEDDAALGTETTNQWIFPSYDHDANIARYAENLDGDFPVVYVSFPSRKDPDWPNRYPDRATMEVITLVPFEAFKDWHDTRWYQRGSSYEDYKAEISDRLLEVVFKHNPHLRGKISTQELSTPLSTRHFCGYPHGEIYGLSHNPERFQQPQLRPQTPIQGYYLTGQDIVTCGVAGALFAGALTTSAILKRNVIAEVMNRTPAGDA